MAHLGKVFESRLRNLWLKIAMLILTIAMVSPMAFSQVDQGAITGVIQDPSGAVVPGAKVTLLNQGTGFVVELTTDNSGTYSSPPLKVGIYTVKAVADGFSQTSQKNVNVTVSQSAGVNLTLKLGSSDQTVSVNGADVAQLQTEDSSTGTTIEAQDILKTPLNGRNFVFIAQLTPGVLPSNQGARGAASGDFSANGQRAEQNNFILDGVDNNVNLVDFPNGASYVVRPPPDALQEFRVITSDYKADLGHSAGAVVIASVKSGTNKFHGRLWEFFRNDALNARNFFPTVGPKPEYRQNQFGFTFGGPVIKDKLFFFADAEANRIVYGQTAQYTVPTVKMRTGDFSDLLQPDLVGGSQNVRQLYVPGGASTQQYLGQNNVYDPASLDPVAQKLINLFPAPNLGVTGLVNNNFQSLSKVTNNTTQYDVRADWNISQKDQTFARYSYTNNPQHYPAPFGILDGGGFGATGSVEVEGRNFTANEAHVFTPTLFNDLSFGYNWLHAAFLQPNSQSDVSSSLGLGGIPYGPFNGGLPVFSVSGMSGFGSPAFETTSEYENVIQVLDSVTKVLGKHTMHAGVSIQRIRVQTLQPDYSRGTYTFDGKFSSVPGSTGTTGYGVADFIEGNISSSQLSSISVVHNQRFYDAAYFQDDWKLTPKFTVNVGVRYEYTQPLNELDGRQANFIPNYATNSGIYLLPNKSKSVALPPAFLAAAAKDNIAVQYTDNNFLVNPDKKDFAPRLGISYKANDTTVVRSGFGMFYGGLESVGFYPNLGENSPFDVDSNFPSTGGCAPGNCPTNGQTLSTGFSAALSQGLANFASVPALRAYQQNVQTPYSMQYNLAVEKSFGQTTATVTYVGASSHHLQSNPDPNQQLVQSAPGGNAQALRPFPDFGGSSLISYGGFSSYNGLQASLEKHYRGSLSYLAGYTYSHSLDDAFLPLGGAGQSGSGYRNWRTLGFGYDYGDSFQDVRHRFTLNGQYELPVGKGKTYLNRGGFSNIVLGGWTGSMVFRVQTGQPSIVYPNNSPTNGVGEANAYRVGDPYSTQQPQQPGVTCAKKTRTLESWVNPCAFANPPVADGANGANSGLSYGPQGRTVFFGPGYNRTDVSVYKNFEIYEGARLQFRADLFNVLNTPAYGQPNNTIGSTFGQITSERFTGLQPDARVAQLAAKYIF